MRFLCGSSSGQDVGAMLCLDCAIAEDTRPRTARYGKGLVKVIVLKQAGTPACDRDGPRRHHSRTKPSNSGSNRPGSNNEPPETPKCKNISPWLPLTSHSTTNSPACTPSATLPQPHLAAAHTDAGMHGSRSCPPPLPPPPPPAQRQGQTRAQGTESNPKALMVLRVWRSGQAAGGGCRSGGRANEGGPLNEPGVKRSSSADLTRNGNHVAKRSGDVTHGILQCAALPSITFATCMNANAEGQSRPNVSCESGMKEHAPVAVGPHVSGFLVAAAAATAPSVRVAAAACGVGAGQRVCDASSSPHRLQGRRAGCGRGAC